MQTCASIPLQGRDKAFSLGRRSAKQRSCKWSTIDIPCNSSDSRFSSLSMNELRSSNALTSSVYCTCAHTSVFYSLRMQALIVRYFRLVRKARLETFAKALNTSGALLICWRSRCSKFWNDAIAITNFYIAKFRLISVSPQNYTFRS